MNSLISEDALAQLRRLDTPTVSNAIESFGVRPRSIGHTDSRIKCLFPELGIAMGYAVTFTTSEYGPAETRGHVERIQLLEAVERAPKPCIVVQQDIGAKQLSACFWGEIQANLFIRLGAEGVISDGTVRDLEAVKEAGLKVWAGGVTASRGDLRVVSVNVSVSVGGMCVNPGDLIHADSNGAVVIPDEISAEIPEVGRKVIEKEKGMLDFIRSPEFSLDKLKKQYYS